MGRDKRNEKLSGFVPLLFRTTDAPAWVALNVYAKALFPMMKKRAGPHGSQNGKFSLSVREAAEYLGCSKDTATRAMHELQAKGFAFPVRVGALGAQGLGNASEWRVTDTATPDRKPATCEFLQWQPGQEYPVKRGKRPPKKTKPCPTR
ncbi:helix-turn-helix domain-containing protein [Halocynthiibacter styelae]|uniref:Helix-turn-helix domain-containing protein n=1 Tax=Halocynthiibacter styelae TaxID=2761955 RepID=A0A8J7J533_9RHOB|nr:helix-turn-helix domain-containing protein [Paenihalocynthiibacter styelae]MBI1493515.1 hypothetical protein [Paenihalocynthiibacter styelae]